MGKYLDILKVMTEPKAADPAISSPKSSATSPTSNDPAAEALAILARLKGYVLPAGRMQTARAIFELLKPLLDVPEERFEPVDALSWLKAIEAELIILGGAYDPELAEAITLVTSVFSGARLVS